MIKQVLKEIELHKDLKRAKLLARFFKTGKGQYGEGDEFFGLTVPLSRKIALQYKDLSLRDTAALLKNKVHEVRLVGVLVLVHKYKIGNLKEKNSIANFYLKNTRYINNWDLVDLSAPRILGDYLFYKNDKNILLKLAKSKNLWKERIAIISTLAFIFHDDLNWTFKIAKIFLSHGHDLIHKATGWMLREAGKKDTQALRKFLDINISKMPRTMLRYAIERFPEKLRLQYLKK